MTGADKLRHFAKKEYSPSITKVNDRIYHFMGWGHSNATAVIAENSVILVDTLDSDKRAQRLKEKLLTITEKPVETIIYTHSHPDHRGGAGAFADTVKEIIAFAPPKPVLQHYDRIDAVLRQRGKYQHGYGLTDDEAICQGIGIREGKEQCDGIYTFLPPTTVYDQKCVERTIDGIPIKLFSAVGETDDTLGVWLPEDKVLCCADNYYGCWPNLYAIRGSQYRDIAAWVDTLDTLLDYPAKALLPGHTRAILGYENIQKEVGVFRDAIRSILFQTLECMNKGMTLEETVAAVQLAEQYCNLPNLGEYYGTVEWSVKSIYCGYVGWFDGDAVNLLPCREQEISDVILELIGDTARVFDKVRSCIAAENYQLALHLLKWLGREQNSEQVLELRRKALLGRAEQVTSANARHYYIWSAKDL